MLKLTHYHSSFTAVLEIEDLSEDTTYVVGDQLQAKLTFTAKRHLSILTINGELSYIVHGITVTSVIKAHQLRLMPQRGLKAGEHVTLDVNIPFHFGRPNFKGSRLNNFWQFKVLIVRKMHKEERSVLQLLPGRDKKLLEANFTIPVSAGKGSYRIKERSLPIPLIDGAVILIGSILTLGVMVALGLMMPDPGVSHGLFISLALMGLLGIILYHFLRLTSFKMTPMEIKPLRDGKVRVHYLNRGKDHLSRAYIGIRLKEQYYEESANDNRTNRKSVIHEDRYRISELARPLDHLNEVVLPWPDLDLPTSYAYKEQGYQWEVFLAASGLVLGGLNEIRWPIHVDWERMRLTAPTQEELKEEKLELRELADNRLEA